MHCFFYIDDRWLRWYKQKQTLPIRQGWNWRQMRPCTIRAPASIDSSKRNKPKHAQEQHLPNKAKYRPIPIEIDAGGPKTNKDT